MPESGMSGSVGAVGGQPPTATRPRKKIGGGGDNHIALKINIVKS
jgi:hypothetical protein